MLFQLLLTLLGLIFLGIILYVLWLKYMAHPLSDEAKKNGWDRDKRDKLVDTLNANIDAFRKDLNITSENKCDMYCVTDTIMKVVPYNTNLDQLPQLLAALVKASLNNDLGKCCNKTSS